MERIIYNSKSEEYKRPFGAVKTDEICTFSIDINKQETPETVTLCIRKDGQDGFSSYNMEFQEDKGEFLRYSCRVSLGDTGLYFYRFEFTCSEGTRFCGERDGAGFVEDWLSEWQLTVYDKNFTTPDWAKNKVMYQIFPDRFCRSTNYTYRNAVNERKIVDDWYAVPETRGNDFFMGNIQGIIEKLPYIKEMGADIIYLNPIFESPENHRYSTGDYMKIDPYLGTNEDFGRLCQDAEKMNIKVILDGVFSHTGADSKYFNKFSHYEDEGAYQGETSPYYKWYNFNNSAVGYECWWGFENLPNVNETHPDYLRFITGEEGVLSYWQDMGASGWRLDVADELPDEFLDALRKRVKTTDPDALIIGEVWEDATNKFAYGERRRYLLGAQLDTVMNYPWRNAIVDYIRSGSAQVIRDEIFAIEENYPKPAIDCLMNMISTHDTERIINAIGVDNQPERSVAKDYIMSPDEWEKGKQGAYFAFFLLFALPGISCVYYGDEVGLDGFRDPYCRKCYPYGREDLEVFEFVKHLAKIKKTYPESYEELIKDIKIKNSALCFTRGELLFCINVGENDENIKIDGEFVTILGKNLPEFVNEMLTIPKKSYGIFTRKTR